MGMVVTFGGDRQASTYLDKALRGMHYLLTGTVWGGGLRRFQHKAAQGSTKILGSDGG